MNNVGLDNFIFKCWEIDEDWKFSLIETEDWWEIRASSKHLGTFRGVSPGRFDIQGSLDKLLKDIKTKKENTFATA